jgi:hypothetical protein
MPDDETKNISSWSNLEDIDKTVFINTTLAQLKKLSNHTLKLSEKFDKFLNEKYVDYGEAEIKALSEQIVSLQETDKATCQVEEGIIEGLGRTEAKLKEVITKHNKQNYPKLLGNVATEVYKNQKRIREVEVVSQNTLSAVVKLIEYIKVQCNGLDSQEAQEPLEGLLSSLTQEASKKSVEVKCKNCEFDLDKNCATGCIGWKYKEKEASKTVINTTLLHPIELTILERQGIKETDSEPNFYTCPNKTCEYTPSDPHNICVHLSFDIEDPKCPKGLDHEAKPSEPTPHISELDNYIWIMQELQRIVDNQPYAANKLYWEHEIINLKTKISKLGSKEKESAPSKCNHEFIPMPDFEYCSKCGKTREEASKKSVKPKTDQIGSFEKGTPKPHEDADLTEAPEFNLGEVFKELEMFGIAKSDLDRILIKVRENYVPIALLEEKEKQIECLKKAIQQNYVPIAQIKDIENQRIQLLEAQIIEMQETHVPKCILEEKQVLMESLEKIIRKDMAKKLREFVKNKNYNTFYKNGVDRRTVEPTPLYVVSLKDINEFIANELTADSEKTKFIKEMIGNKEDET